MVVQHNVATMYSHHVSCQIGSYVKQSIVVVVVVVGSSSGSSSSSSSNLTTDL